MKSLLVLTDGGSDVGLGHVRRCLTLAGALREEDVFCTFHVRGGNAAKDFVEQHRFDAVAVDDFGGALPETDGILIDSYRIDERLFTVTTPVIVIDDIADRELPVAVILNPGAGAESLTYSARSDTLLLLGVQYALLRREFAEPFEREIAPSMRRIMITLGGSDHGPLAADLVRWAQTGMSALHGEQTTIDVIVGPFFQRVDDLRALAKANERVKLLFDPSDMRNAMFRCDGAISSGGQTLDELAATGTPALAISTADNQQNNIAALADAGTIVYVEERTEAALVRGLATIAPAETRREMSRRGRALVDGRGARRAASEIARVLGASRRMNE
jgi:UDP-2,4-diacetamido-2,4,6-trideoxy-beta-L-altropyranose hydrolase